MKHPTIPLRDTTGSHWVQLMRDGESDWVWCCTVCQSLSVALSATPQTPPHISTAAHLAKLSEWDTDERHACIRLHEPVWPVPEEALEVTYQ